MEVMSYNNIKKMVNTSPCLLLSVSEFSHCAGRSMAILQNTGPLFQGIHCYVVLGKMKELILTNC